LQSSCFILFRASGAHPPRTDTLSRPRADRRSPLLNDVGQLVSQEFLPGRTIGVVAAIAKENVLACGESNRVHLAVQHIGGRAGMDPDTGEVSAERRLHLQSDSALQSPPGVAGILDPCFDLRGNFSFGSSLPGQGQNPLYEAIAILPLQL